MREVPEFVPTPGAAGDRSRKQKEERVYLDWDTCHSYSSLFAREVVIFILSEEKGVLSQKKI